MARIPSTAPIDSVSNLDSLLNGYSVESADSWLRQLFGSYDASMHSEIELGINKNEKEYFDSAVLLGYIKELPHDFKLFVNEVIEDIQQFGSLPRRTIKKMGEATTAQAIHDILVDIARVRGFDYVHKLRDRAIQEEIVVTVQRN